MKKSGKPSGSADSLDSVGPAGRALLDWISEQYQQIEVEAAKPLVMELAKVQDRLVQVRAQLAKDGITPAGKKHSLVDAELKLSAQFVKIWRALGLADKPAEEKRPVGRPPDSERLQRWGA